MIKTLVGSSQASCAKSHKNLICPKSTQTYISNGLLESRHFPMQPFITGMINDVMFKCYRATQYYICVGEQFILILIDI